MPKKPSAIRLRSPMPKELFRKKLAETMPPPEKHRSSPAEPKVGDRMPDGTVYAGISPDTNKPMYAMSQDGLLTYTFNEATRYAAKLNAYGHKDWRVPTPGELNVLFNNRAAIGGFDITGSNPAGWYWSASPNYIWHAWGQRFNDGYQGFDGEVNQSSLRCVR